MKKITKTQKICLVAGLLLATGFLLTSCSYNIENNTYQAEEAKKGTVVLTLENHLAELGTDVTAIQATTYQVDIFNNGTKADSFSVNVSSGDKYVSDTRTVTVSKTYKAGEYTAVVYAQDANGKNFGKGSLDFNVIGDTTVSKTAAVEYKIHTVDDFVEPTQYKYSENEKWYAYLTNTKTQPDVKYVEIKDFLINLIGKNEEYYNATLTADGTVYRITNKETNSYLEIDTNNETMRFSNFEAFTHSSADDPLVTAVSTGVGKVVNQYNIPGNDWTFSYGHYMVGDDSGSIYSLDITPFKKADGTACCYIPFNICTDLYIFWQNINFNGKAFVQAGTNAYYDSNLTRTQAVKEFNFLEFCFNMDMNYGLAQEHGITNGFASWLKNLDGGSVYNKLMSDNTTTDLREAYYQIVYKYFGDIHSSYENHSFYETAAVPSVRTLIASNPSDFSASWHSYITTLSAVQVPKVKSKLLVKEVSTDGTTIADYEGLQLWGYNSDTKTYEKIDFSYNAGNQLIVTTNLNNFSGITLFVTFDSFFQSSSNSTYINKPDYYVSETEKADAYPYTLRNGAIKHYGVYSTQNVKCIDAETGINYDSSTDLIDTRSLTRIANRLVQEFDAKNSSNKIANIVVDLSCNGGGSVDAGAYIGTWLMGQFDDCVENPITKAASVTTYMFDINGDEKIGSYGSPNALDTVCNKRLFVITTQCSFSCANMLACKLKNAGKTVVLGSTSGGGACCVLSIATVDGTKLNVSSNLKFSNEKNGSFYSIDQGVAADYQFTSWDDYANRAYITKVVDTVYAGL